MPSTCIIVSSLVFTIGFAIGVYLGTPKADPEPKSGEEPKAEPETKQIPLTEGALTPLRIKIPMIAPPAPRKLTRQNALVADGYYPLPTEVPSLKHISLGEIHQNFAPTPQEMNAYFTETPSYTPVFTPE